MNLAPLLLGKERSRSGFPLLSSVLPLSKGESEGEKIG